MGGGACGRRPSDRCAARGPVASRSAIRFHGGTQPIHVRRRWAWRDFEPPRIRRRRGAGDAIQAEFLDAARAVVLDERDEVARSDIEQLLVVQAELHRDTVDVAWRRADREPGEAVRVHGTCVQPEGVVRRRRLPQRKRAGRFVRRASVGVRERQQASHARHRMGFRRRARLRLP